MKRSFNVLVYILLISISVSSIGGAKPKTKAGTGKFKTKRVGAKYAQLSTSVQFSGSEVSGKFQTAPESVATVEDDKYLNNLLGVPAHFNNRIESEKSRY